MQGDHGGLVTSDQEQQKFLDEASTSVKRNAFFMKKALVRGILTVMAGHMHHRTLLPSTLLKQDDDNLREALRYSAAMLGELRTSQLTPQKYFELYMQTFTELQHLEVSLIGQCATCVLLHPDQSACEICPCRCSSKKSTRRAGSMLTYTSWSSMRATSCLECKAATLSPF